MNSLTLSAINLGLVGAALFLVPVVVFMRARRIGARIPLDQGVMSYVLIFGGIVLVFLAASQIMAGEYVQPLWFR